MSRTRCRISRKRSARALYSWSAGVTGSVICFKRCTVWRMMTLSKELYSSKPLLESCTFFEPKVWSPYLGVGQGRRVVGRRLLGTVRDRPRRLRRSLHKHARWGSHLPPLGLNVRQYGPSSCGQSYLSHQTRGVASCSSAAEAPVVSPDP